jgi:thiamine biosynthesis protein ThiI
VSSIIVHYGEIALKGRNRPWFIHVLVRSIRTLLADLSVSRVRSHIGRIVITLDCDDDWPEVRARLSRLPGISNFANAERTPADVEAIASKVEEGVAGRQARSFRVLARRADKRFPVPSPELERIVGARVQRLTGWPVNLSKPDFVIRVEVLTNEAYVFLGRESGSGGLPVATSGRVMTLLSGGIDSPVAAWRMIRRGCRTHFVHFHSYPILSRTSQDKARELVRLLTRHQLRSKLFLVPFGAVQQQIVLAVPPALRVVIYRRMMTRIAETLARDNRAYALITGDSVGQVASQTVENLSVVSKVATLPLLRPLIGMDKEEITTDAKRIGTYDTSIVPDDDCCTLFTPRSPTTGASLADVEGAEAALDVAGLTAQAVAAAEFEVFRFPQTRVRESHALV